MDVHCTTCGEPWDTYHLQHDAIWETGMPEEEIKAWERLPQGEKLSANVRDEFESIGFRFGRTFLNVVRCPSCPKGAEPDAGTMTLKAELESILGDDEDGLASTFDELGL